MLRLIRTIATWYYRRKVKIHSVDLTISINKCPKCGAKQNAIDWDEIMVDGTQAWQKAQCTVCDCRFDEVYEYINTEIRD